MPAFTLAFHSGGKAAGWEVPTCEGATGYFYRTNTVALMNGNGRVCLSKNTCSSRATGVNRVSCCCRGPESCSQHLLPTTPALGKLMPLLTSTDTIPPPINLYTDTNMISKNETMTRHTLLHCKAQGLLDNAKLFRTSTREDKAAFSNFPMKGSQTGNSS